MGNEFNEKYAFLFSGPPMRDLLLSDGTSSFVAVPHFRWVRHRGLLGCWHHGTRHHLQIRPGLAVHSTRSQHTHSLHHILRLVSYSKHKPIKKGSFVVVGHRIGY